MKALIALTTLAIALSACERKTAAPEATAPPVKVKQSEPQTVLDLPDPMEGATQHSAAAEGVDGTTSIYRLLRRNLAMVNACYKRQRRRDPQLAGKLTVKMRVGPGPKGMVEQAEVVARTFNNATMERCVVGSLKAFSFPREKAEPLEMTVPLLFR